MIVAQSERVSVWGRRDVHDKELALGALLILVGMICANATAEQEPMTTGTKKTLCGLQGR